MSMAKRVKQIGIVSVEQVGENHTGNACMVRLVDTDGAVFDLVFPGEERQTVEGKHIEDTPVVPAATT
jgi:hypothetical protein